MEKVELLNKHGPLGRWLALTGCEGAEASRVRQLLTHRIDGDDLRTRHVLLKAQKR